MKRDKRRVESNLTIHPKLSDEICNAASIVYPSIHSVRPNRMHSKVYQLFIKFETCID